MSNEVSNSDKVKTWLMEKLPWIFIILGVTALLIGYDKQGIKVQRNR